MNQKTLIGFILIGAILLFWPTYLDIISPEPSKKEEGFPLQETVIKNDNKKEVVVSKQASPPLSILKNIFTVETPLLRRGLAIKTVVLLILF